MGDLSKELCHICSATTFLQTTSGFSKFQIIMENADTKDDLQKLSSGKLDGLRPRKTHKII
jgi:hypothetical protein